MYILCLDGPVLCYHILDALSFPACCKVAGKACERRIACFIIFSWRLAPHRGRDTPSILPFVLPPPCRSNWCLCIFLKTIRPSNCHAPSPLTRHCARRWKLPGSIC